MPGRQFSLAALLLWIAAAGIWIVVVGLLGSGPGWGAGPGYVITLAVLIGVTLALHVLLRDRSQSWPIAAIVAPLISIAAILLIALVTRSG